MGGSEKWTENGAHVFNWPDFLYTRLWHRAEPCINRVWPMTFRVLFDGRHFRSKSLEKYMAVFCVDFAENCTIGTSNMSIQYYVHEQVAAQNQQINPCAYWRQRKMDRKWRPRFQLARFYLYTALVPRAVECVVSVIYTLPLAYGQACNRMRTMAFECECECECLIV